MNEPSPSIKPVTNQGFNLILEAFEDLVEILYFLIFNEVTPLFT
jgi:hypothetical protein